MIRAPAIVAGLVLMVLPASADWRYAKWGMTKTQIIAASKGEAREFRIGDDFVCAFSGLKIMAIVPRKDISGTPFDVSFCSSANGRLSSVSLNALGANINLFKRTMVSQYGRPLSDTGGITIWNDEKARNTVTLIDVVGVAVRIEYKPMGGSGL